MPNAKGFFSEQHRSYMGIYWGPVSSPGCSEIVEAADVSLFADPVLTDDGGYPVPRRSTNFWFLVTGRQAASMFAKICGVDLRPHKFANHDIAQTSVARTNVGIVRDDQGDLPVFHLLGDGASAEYMWGCLLDAMDEFGGGPVGYLA